MSNYMIRQLPEELRQWLKIQAIKDGKTLNQLVIAILTQYKEREGGK